MAIAGIDLAIAKALQEGGVRSRKSAATQLGITEANLSRRTGELANAGAFSARMVTILEPKFFSFEAFALMEVTTHQQKCADGLAVKLSERCDVMQVYLTLNGGIILIVVGTDTPAIARVQQEVLGLDEVRNVTITLLIPRKTSHKLPI